MGSSREEVGKEAFPSEDTPLLHKATANDRRKMKGVSEILKANV